MKKRFFLAIVLALLVMLPTVSLAQESNVQASGVKTADTLVATGVGYFHGIMVVTDGANTCTVTVYDNTSAAGTKMFPSVIVPAAASYGMAYSFNPPRIFRTGLYVDITTSGTCSFDVDYSVK